MLRHLQAGAKGAKVQRSPTSWVGLSKLLRSITEDGYSAAAQPLPPCPCMWQVKNGDPLKYSCLLQVFFN